MKHMLKVIAVVAVLGLVAAACGGDGAGDATDTPTAGTDLAGGTLTMAMLSDVDAAFDPAKEYYAVTWEFYRCCLLRTMMSYKGVPTDEGGDDLLADLAAAEPEVAPDGLTWTFKIKEGVRYAPPKDDTVITAEDFIRALERVADPKANTGGYSFYYSVIVGFDDFADGKAESIEGLSAPDASTLEVKLTAPTGDLGYRFSMPASAPIPPDDEGERLGVAEGHERDYGRFLVSSGPYMFEGSEALDFSLPTDQQEQVTGYIPGRQIVLVRNPAWDPATDELRPAYVDRMEITIGGNDEDLYNQVQAGTIDYVIDGVVPAEKIREYQTNPDLQDRIHAYPVDGVRYISFNLALPPFDDIHIRKAFNYALDKSGMRQLRGGPATGEIAGHLFVDAVEGNLLQEYDPFETPNGGGDLEAAKAEIALSNYDADGDGVCDDPSCEDILSYTDREDPYPKQAALVQQNFEPLGMTFDVKELERTTMYDKCNDAESHHALCLGAAWFKDYTDGYTFGGPLFGSEGLWESCCNYGLLGATPEQLQGWGYDVTEVPTVDEKVTECSALVGDERAQCWADLDQQLMEEVVPWVPYLFDSSVDIVSDNVAVYSFDQFGGIGAFERFAVAEKGS